MENNVKKTVYFQILFLMGMSLCILPIRINAQDFWQKTAGPFGGSVLCFAVDSSGRIYLGSSRDGVYTSTNNGSSWTHSSLSNTNGGTRVLVVTNSGKILAGIDASTGLYTSTGTLEGLFQSTDNGSTWTSSALNATMPRPLIHAATIIPGGNVFVSISSWSTSAKGIYRSTDDGATWTQRNYLSNYPDYLASDSAGELYAIAGGQVYKSVDSSNTWSSIYSSYPPPNQIAVNSANHIFVTLDYGYGLMKSTDGGSTWSSGPYGVGITFGLNGYGYVGTDTTSVIRSTNNGATWSSVVKVGDALYGDSHVEHLFVDRSGNVFYGSAVSGNLYRSTDNGITWSTANTGLTNRDFNHSASLAVSPNGKLYATTDASGFYRSTDNGASWTTFPVVLLQQGGDNYTSTGGISIDNAGRIFLNTNATSNVQHFLRSTDEGATWSLSTPIGGNTPLGPPFAYASNGDMYSESGYPYAVYRSTDNGSSWTQQSSFGYGYLGPMAVSPTGRVFCSEGGGAELHYSDDNGQNWTNSSGIGSSVAAIAFNPSGNVFVGSADGVWRSTNDGASFTQVRTSTAYTLAINKNGIIFVGELGGMIQSTDNGGSWQQLTSGMTNTYGVRSLTFDSSGYLYSGNIAGGIFRSNIVALPVEIASFTVAHDGQNVVLKWATSTEVDNSGFEIERRLVNLPAETHRVQAGAQFTQAGFVSGSGTSTGPKQYSFVDQNLSAGLYSYRLKQLDRNGSFKYTQEVQIEVGTAPRVFSLGQNYPNPFNPSTTIQFTIPQDGRVTLRIFDLLGRDVATLIDQDMKAGVYQQVVFDASKSASGVYFSRLEFGGKQQLKKMILLR
jgi:hypothetical protein